MKTKILIGVMMIILLSTLSFDARAADASFYESFKQKAVAVYHHYYNKFFGKNDAKPVAQTTAQDNRVPASAPEAAVAPAPSAASADQEKLAALPSFKTPGVEEQTQKIKEIQQNVAAQSAYQRKEGVEADPSLKKTKSGVAVFDLYEKPSGKNNQKGDKSKTGKMVKNIPLLNIGVEAEITQSKFDFQLPKLLTADFQKIKELPTPDMKKQSEIDSLAKEKIELAQKPEKIEDVHLSFPKEINAEQINKISLTIDPEKPIQLVAYTEITAQQIELLKGLIFAEYQDRCHLSTGFLKKLTGLVGEEKNLRDYYYGTCLFKQGFFTEAVPRLLEIAKHNIPTFSKNSVDLLLTDLNREYVDEAAEALVQVKAENIPEKKTNEYNYYIALGLSMKGEYKSALTYALKVKPDSKKYPEAQYIAAVAEYLAGDVKSSLERQEKLLVEIDKRGLTGPLKSLVNMNRGRTAYRNKKYKEAIDAYKFIGRENSMWIQSLTEQGWMQVLANDAPGAIGNMHSIQVPQFKDIYKPDSYVVRAIGYINICQYGDAKKSLDHLAKIYFPWLQAIRGELKKDQFNYVFYQNVVDALRSPENKTSLAQPILREISRHKDFLNIQEAINNKVDEETQFGFINGLIQKDMAKAKGKMAAAKAKAKALDVKIKTASTAKDTIKFVGQWKAERNFELETADYYNFEIATIQESLDGYKNYQADARKKIDEVKQSMKSAAGKTMKNRLAKMEKKLAKIMENNEFLTYEIFSGSGENIRYVSAGGNTKGTQSTRETASKEAPAGKLFLWDFDGEFWADEVGNYKSSLKDNCPNANNLTQKVQ